MLIRIFTVLAWVLVNLLVFVGELLRERLTLAADLAPDDDEVLVRPAYAFRSELMCEDEDTTYTADGRFIID